MIKRQNAFTIRNNRGFSLLEVMVGLILMSLLVLAAISGGGIGGFSTRKELDETFDTIERAIRFAQDESALRNVIVRVHIDLSKEPQEFTVEFGPDANFIIPKSALDFGQADSPSEEDEENKEREKLNKNFNKVQEFEETSEEFSEAVRIIGVGTSLSQGFFTDGQASIYFYPNGEKDAAIFLLGTDDEVASLTTEAFTQRFERNYININDQLENDDLEEVHLSQAKEVYEQWSK